MLIVSAGAAIASDVDVRVAALKGAVEYERAGVVKPLSVGDVLRSGDIVVTGADGQVSLVWGGGNLARLKPLSRFVLDNLSESGGDEISSLLIEKGNMFAKAAKLSTEKSTFTIRTPTAIAGVRGSEIFVSVTPERTNMAVLSGAFEIRAEGLDVMLNQNFQISIGDEPAEIAAAEPEPMSETQMEELRSEADAIYEEAGVEEEPAEAEEEATESTIDETVTSDTITNPAVDDTVELMEGTGGVNLTIE